MQNTRSEVLELLNCRGLVSWQKAMYLMYQHGWTKRQLVEVLAHSLTYRYDNSPFEHEKPRYKKRASLAIKRTIISALSKRKMRPRYSFNRLIIPMGIKYSKLAVCLNTEDDFMYLISELIKNHNLFNQL